jgi:hypothetical protein
MSDYDFRVLSSFDFELLVRDLLHEETGLYFHSFKTGKDAGIDLRYTNDSGNTKIVQAKHYAESGFNALLNAVVKSESAKVGKLNPSEYIFTTSVPLSPHQSDQLKSAIKANYSGPVIIFGKEDLNSLLRKHPSVEQRHYKLWLSSRAVLERVLHSGIVNATGYDVESIERRARLYVQGKTFSKAYSLLEKEHVCIISGIPGVGKTTLAEMLIAHYIDSGYRVSRITNRIEEGYEADDPDPNAKMVFYYDDFLGQSSLTEKLGKNEDGALLRFMDSVHRRENRRFILTTREYLLQQASEIHEKLRHSDMGFYRFVLDLGQYNRADRSRILFNHLYFSELPEEYRSELIRNRVYLKIIDHPNYSPRLIEWMTRRSMSQSVQPKQYAAEFVRSLDNPTEIWKSAFDNQISSDSRMMLFVLYNQWCASRS